MRRIMPILVRRHVSVFKAASDSLFHGDSGRKVDDFGEYESMHDFLQTPGER
jgi:hypothetical protein